MRGSKVLAALLLVCLAAELPMEFTMPKPVQLRLGLRKSDSVYDFRAARDNRHRRRVHVFPALQSNRLRLHVLETNGARCARIYEVRVYNETRV